MIITNFYLVAVLIKNYVQLSIGQILSNVVKLAKFVFGPPHLPRALSSRLLLSLSSKLQLMIHCLFSNTSQHTYI